MKRFLSKLIAFFVLQLFLFFCVHRLYLAEYPPAENCYAAVIDKQRLLETQAPPRLIFVGGSATLFGVKAGAVASQVGMQPVNMGLHIGFGLPFMLNQVSSAARPGDVVILAPEYDLFASDYAGNPEVHAYVLETWPRALRFMEPRQVASALDRGFLQRAGRVTRAVVGRSAVGLENTGPIYRRSSIDQNGDLDVAQFGRSPLKEGARIRFSDRQAVSPAFERLNRFQEECRLTSSPCGLVLRPERRRPAGT